MSKDSVFLEYQHGTGFPYLRDIDELKTSLDFKRITKEIIEKYINNGAAKIKYGKPFYVMLPIIIISFCCLVPFSILFFP